MRERGQLNAVKPSLSRGFYHKNNMQKYIFNRKNEDGTTTREEVEMKRWVWGVLYHPTQEQLDAVPERLEARNRGYEEEIKLRKKAMQERGDISEELINEMERDFRKKMTLPMQPERTQFHQFGADGEFHQIGEIDQDRVAIFSLYRSDDPTKRIDMPMEKGMRIIFLYKMVKAWYLDEMVRVYCLGFKKGSVKSFMFILPDDRIIFSSDEVVNLPEYALTTAKMSGNID